MRRKVSVFECHSNALSEEKDKVNNSVHLWSEEISFVEE